MRRAKIIIPLLGLAMTASFYYAWKETPRIKRVPGSESSRVVVPIASAGAEDSRLNFSGGEKRKFRQPKRDLFSLLYPAPAAPVKPKTVRPPIKQVSPVVKTVKPLPPPIPVRSTIRRMPTFQVLGFLEKMDQVTAFVSLQGEIYLVKQNQQFAEEYQVAELDLEQIRITRIRGVGEVSLPLKAATGGIR